MNILVLAVVISVLSVVAGQTTLNVLSYQASNPDIPTQSDFPEMKYLSGKPNTAIGFTGGGSRAFVAAIGELAALNSLDLMKNVRYIGGISGGAWATMTYSFDNSGVSDDILLGSVAPPEKISRIGLNIMDSRCARSFASSNLTLIALKAWKDKQVDNFAGAWAHGVQTTYFDPVNIATDAPFTWNQDTLNDIVKRNPSLKDTKFMMPKAGRPFPLIGTTMSGPLDYAPYNEKNHNMTLLEITPLYVGQMHGMTVQYTDGSGLVKRTHSRTVGGAVEPIGVSRCGSASPSMGLLSSQTVGTLKVPAPETVLDVRFAAAASSYAPGVLLESVGIQNISAAFDMYLDYWSPSDRVPKGMSSLFGDGGSFENIPLISFLQRRVAKIVLFFNSESPILPSSSWNVAEDLTYDGQITDCFSSFFGVMEDSLKTWQNRSWDYSKNQVYSKEDYVTVIQGLQDAQAKGNGIIFRKQMTTIENQWWGIPAGIVSDVTFVYLGRLSGWESLLSSDMASLLVPEGDAASNLSVDVSSGPFRGFPHYATTGGEINHERANALADLTGWSVLKNADLFRSILS